MSASSYNGINGQALYMYVIMWTRRHVGIIIYMQILLAHGHYICMSLCGHVGMSACQCNSRYYCLMGIGASVHRCADMPSGRPMY